MQCVNHCASTVAIVGKSQLRSRLISIAALSALALLLSYSGMLVKTWKKLTLSTHWLFAHSSDHWFAVVQRWNSLMWAVRVLSLVGTHTRIFNYHMLSFNTKIHAWLYLEIFSFTLLLGNFPSQNFVQQHRKQSLQAYIVHIHIYIYMNKIDEKKIMNSKKISIILLFDIQWHTMQCYMDLLSRF